MEFIGPSDFFTCSGLKEVLFEAGSHLRDIKGFQFCGSLIRIDIPASVELIWSSAFSGCSGLKEVIFEVGSHLRDIKGFQFCGTHRRNARRRVQRLRQAPQEDILFLSEGRPFGDAWTGLIVAQLAAVAAEPREGLFARFENHLSEVHTDREAFREVFVNLLVVIRRLAPCDAAVFGARSAPRGRSVEITVSARQTPPAPARA
jgi:hypothetical protein